MRAFTWPVCTAMVFFGNSRCLTCGTALAFDREPRTLVALAEPLRRCANTAPAACNWGVRADGTLCQSCALTRTLAAHPHPAGDRQAHIR
jgi:hypothetical protein